MAGLKKITIAALLMLLIGTALTVTAAGDDSYSTVPEIIADNVNLEVRNCGNVKDIFVISGSGYTCYNDIKAAKQTADFYGRVTANKIGEDRVFRMTLKPFYEYTVLARTLDGSEYLKQITTDNTHDEVCKVSVNSAMQVKFEAPKRVKVIRYAPGAGIRTASQLRITEGYRAVKRGSFKKYDPLAEYIDLDGVESFRCYPGTPGVYSYVVEYTDGVQEFGEFELVAEWEKLGKTPIFTSKSIMNLVQNRFIKAYYAPGYWTTEAEVKSAPGSRTIMKVYTVRDVEVLHKIQIDPITGKQMYVTHTNNLSTRHYYFKKELSGEYTFSITWGNVYNRPCIYHVTF